MDGLEKSLTDAFIHDAKRKAEDDMKKRAIVSARSYDEFRHLVAAAQQKPIEKDDMARKAEVAANKGFGAIAAGRAPSSLGFDLRPAAGPSTVPATAPSLGYASASDLPASFPHFERAWRRLPKEAGPRAKYLAQIGLDRLRLIFAHDLDGELLGALIGALVSGGPLPAGDGVEDVCAGHAGVVRIALALSTSTAFPLALDLLSKGDIDALRLIRDRAAADGAAEASAQLCTAYQLS